MKITIHRGTDRIGGCVTEYEERGWRLFVDYGEQLPGSPEGDTPLQIEGLTHGDLSRSALLITHYHGDHIGRIAELPAELPIFMGRIAKEIALEHSGHMSSVSEASARLAERLVSVNTFSPGEAFSFGDFTVMPVVIDHSAFDAYAFRIEARELKVFHTGDFRTHGFRSAKLPQVIEKYVGRVDYVVCEATNINSPDLTAMPEYELQSEFTEAFNANKYNVVYVSSTNIDRLFGLYHAALRAGRPFYVTAYQKRIMDIVAGRDNVWGKSRMYRYKEGREPVTLQRESNGDFRVNDKFVDFLTEHGYVIIAGAGERFDNLLARIPAEGRKKYLSMWGGYVDKSRAAYNPALAASLGGDYDYMHTSGHCDMQSIDSLFDMLKPYAVIPIHTDNPSAFADLFSDKWPVMLLNDGETFAPIKDPGYDTITAHVYAVKKPDESLEAVANPDGLAWYSFDDANLGEFKSRDDADFALRHVAYAPNRFLAYAIEEVEDMEPCVVKVFDREMNLLSEHYNSSHRKPGENEGDKSWVTTPGEKVLCIFEWPYDAVVPAILDGPIDESHIRKWYKDAKEEGSTFARSFKQYLRDLSGWSLDEMAVTPLVRLKSEYQEMTGAETVNRVYIFPWREFDVTP